MSEKAAERSKLLVRLGQLLAPIRELVERPSPPTAVELRVIAAQLEESLSRWKVEFSRYATVGEVRFIAEYRAIIALNARFHKTLGSLSEGANAADTKNKIQKYLDKYQSDVIKLIDDIPIDWEAKLTSAKSPFTVSLMIDDAICTAKNRVDYLDRYLTPDFFPLYLRNLRRDVAVTLVTTPGNKNYGVQSVTPIAKLAVQEFTAFRLVEVSPSELHDRNLRVDDIIFHLGPSVQHAGVHPSNFNKTDCGPAGHKVIDDIIGLGKVVAL